MRILSLVFACALLRGGECFPVNGTHILAGDLAGIDAGFAGLIPDKPLLLSPRAGVVRQLSAADIRRIALREGFEPQSAVNACFSWPMKVIDPNDVRRAMAEAIPDSSVEVLELSNQPIPPGSIEFNRLALSVVDNGTGVFIWRGSVRYAERQVFPIWAKVRLSVDTPCALAADKLSAGVVITADMLRSADRPLPVTVAVNCVSAAAATGKLTRRPVRAGEPLRNIDIELVPAVSIGEDVSVDVYKGRAHLALVAKAEGRGATGDRIYLRNTRSGKRFLARISAPGRAEVGAIE